MRIEFDPAKNDWNLRQRGLSFERAAEFDFDSALVKEDDRSAYSQQRYVAIGLLAVRVHVLVFSPLPDGIRVISFRKANAREVKRYEATSTLDR